MRLPSRHGNFFSSLKQVEKRLISEEIQLKNSSSSSSSSSSSQPLATSTNDLASSSMPIYLNDLQTQHHSKPISSSIELEDSDPPSQFLSESPDQFLQLQQHPSCQSNQLQRNCNNNDDENEGKKNKIEELIELLGLFDLEEYESGLQGDDGFYSRIVGIKGPKCEKEVKRLNGWIQYLMRDFVGGGGGDDNGGISENDDREGLKLAYLLLGKAAAAAAADARGIEFPSTVQEFLEHDPPTCLINQFFSSG